VPALNHLHLHVRSVERAKTFYESYFGLREHVWHDGILFMRDDCGMDLALAPSDQPEVMPPWFHFGFRLDTPEAVRALHASLPRDAIAQPLTEEPDFAVFRCKDPDGHLIEVYWEPQPA
jgi:catechol 2,3-dioxygenase-like lactoylglutathione lyase family enzyme